LESEYADKQPPRSRRRQSAQIKSGYDPKQNGIDWSPARLLR